MMVLLVVLVEHTSPYGRRGGSPWYWCFLFSFRSEIGLRRPAMHRRNIVDPPEDEAITAPSQAASPMLVIKPSSLVSSPFQAMAPSAASPRQAGTQSKFAPSAFFACTPPPMLLKEDARALFSCLVYHRHSTLTVLLLSSTRSC